MQAVPGPWYPGRHTQAVNVAAPGEDVACSGHGVHGSLPVVVLYEALAHVTQEEPSVVKPGSQTQLLREVAASALVELAGHSKHDTEPVKSLYNPEAQGPHASPVFAAV